MDTIIIIIIIITVQTSIMSMMYKVIYLFILTNKYLNSLMVFTADKLQMGKRNICKHLF